MKRKRKLIPLELQKRYDKLLAVVPELATIQDVQQSLDIIKGCTNAEGFNALGYAFTNVFESAWLKDAKLIYEFDKTLFETLSGQTDLSVASDTLKRLPFRCAYVSMPIKLTGPQGTPMDGFFALKAEDVIKCLFVSTDTMAFGQLNIHLSAKTFEESENLSVKEAQRYGTEFARSPNSVTTKTSKLITQLLLYLCASNADVQERRPTTTQTKKTSKTTDKRPVRHWDVGIRVGATIKRNRSYAAKTQHKGGEHKQHARPRPHLRRGHWSHFWTGKRDSADRERILKWIEPVYINADSPDDLPTTIHRVK